MPIAIIEFSLTDQSRDQRMRDIAPIAERHHATTPVLIHTMPTVQVMGRPVDPAMR